MGKTLVVICLAAAGTVFCIAGGGWNFLGILCALLFWEAVRDE